MPKLYREIEEKDSIIDRLMTDLATMKAQIFEHESRMSSQQQQKLSAKSSGYPLEESKLALEPSKSEQKIPGLDLFALNQINHPMSGMEAYQYEQ